MADTSNELKDHFIYSDGVLYWKQDIKYSTVKAGQLAGYFDVSSGYWRVRFKKKSYLLHRLVFELHKGYSPKLLDHIDRDKTNNRIENLREASVSLNRINTGLPKNNTSGVKGVSFNSQLGKWHSTLTLNCKRLHLGFFNSFSEAEKARKSAELTFYPTDTIKKG